MRVMTYKIKNQEIRTILIYSNECWMLVYAVEITDFTNSGCLTYCKLIIWILPKDVSACFSSFLSIVPELSRSNPRKQFCQSVTYFHNAENS